MPGADSMDDPGKIELREVERGDLPVLFEQQLDPQANWMAAFTAKDPTDCIAFVSHWTRILADRDIVKRTILCQGEIAGSILSFEQEGMREVSYWLGKPFWGKGIATRALQRFLVLLARRPLYARVAKDNLGSLRVLEKCGFAVIAEERGFANARGEEIDEYLLRFDDAGGVEA